MDERDENCVFCKILRGEAPGHIVGQNEQAVALLDIFPLARGHCLIIPRRHVPWWPDLTPEETAGLFELARQTAKKIMKVYQPEFVSLLARGRRIPHTHIFLVPTSAGDSLDRYFNALEGFQEGAHLLVKNRQPAELQATFEELRAGGD